MTKATTAANGAAIVRQGMKNHRAFDVGKINTDSRQQHPQQHHQLARKQPAVELALPPSPELNSRKRPRQRQRQRQRQILSEEEFQSNLTHIIRRDYYPDVAALEQHLQASEMNAPLALTSNQLCPIGQDNTPSHQQQQRCPLHMESVTGFHSRATSQDNEHFELHQEQEQQRLLLERDTFVRGERSIKPATAQGKAAVPISRALIDSPLPLASDQFNITELQQQQQQQHATLPQSQVQNGLFFDPPPLSEAHQAEDEPVSSGTPTLASNNQNGGILMPPPRNFMATKTVHVKQYATSIDHNPTMDTNKRVVPAATRFPNTKALLPPTASARHFEGSVDLDSTTSRGHDDSSNNEMEMASSSSITDLSTWTADVDSPVRLVRAIRSLEESTTTTTAATAANDNHMSNMKKSYSIPEPGYHRDQAARWAQSALEARAARARAATTAAAISMDQRLATTTTRGTIEQQHHHLARIRSRKQTSSSSSATLSTVTAAATTTAAVRSVTAISARSRDSFGSALRATYGSIPFSHNDSHRPPTGITTMTTKNITSDGNSWQ